MVGTPRKPCPTAHSAQLSPAPTAAAQHLAPLSPGQLAGLQLSLPPSQAENHILLETPRGLESSLLPLPLSGLPLTCWDPGRELEWRRDFPVFCLRPSRETFNSLGDHLLQGIATFVYRL